MTGDAQLVDAAARRTIENDLGSTVFVEAGAGSGKTTELVRRIVALVVSGALITEVAAITFTEAAAAELRIRVREGLTAAAWEAEAASPARVRCVEALSRIDEAPISTIHGFCQRLLAAHPIEVGLPPRIEVLDEISESIEWRRRWSARLDHMAAEPAMADLVRLGWSLGVGSRRVEMLARVVDRDWHLNRTELPDVEEVMATAARRAERGIAELHDAIRDAAFELSQCSDSSDRLFSQIAGLEEFAADLSAMTRWQEALPFIATLAPRDNLGNQGNWDDVQRARGLVGTVKEVSARLISDLFDLSVLTLAHCLEVYAREDAIERRRVGRLTFHDLLVLAGDLLKNPANGGVRSAVRKRYRYILIDEFQDTDPLQLEISSLIGREGDGWEPGRCFFVGDPKQSIYRFRGADLDAYVRARTEIVGDGGATLLTSNFRSAPGIIDFVNGCFADLLGEHFQGLDAARSGGVLAEYGANGGAVSVMGGVLEKKMRRREQRRIESEDVARLIEAAVSVEQWGVVDRNSEAERPARFGDVAILVPRRTGLAEIEAALDERGIGYRVESASLIFKSQEVRDVLALARALDEPGNHAAVVATLRSPAYSIGDDELVAWARAGGRWSIEGSAVATRAGAGLDGADAIGPAAAAPSVAWALADLARLRGNLAELGPVGALSAAVRERRLLQVAADRPKARESWRRIRFVVDRARAFVEAGGRSLAEFADWVDEQVEGGLRSAESVVPDSDEDVVRIMTVHGAKGLEFPITILCGFGTTDSTRVYDTILRADDSETQVHFAKDFRTSKYAQFAEEDKRRDDEEALRLLYVAATRARDHLVVCGHHVEAGQPTMVERLLEAMDSLPEQPRRIASVYDGVDRAPVTAVGLAGREAPEHGVDDVLGISTIEDYEAWCERREAVLAIAHRKASVRATEVSGPSPAGVAAPSSVAEDATAPMWVDADEADDVADTDDDQVLPGAVGHRTRGRAGTQIGRAVHATLQTVTVADARVLGSAAAAADLGRGAEGRLKNIADVQAQSERVPDRADHVARLAAAALRSPVVREAFQGGRAKRETYVSTRVGPTVLDGFVDLCFIDNSGALVVVDYKTDSVRNAAEAAERAAGYELQIAAYALALSDATGLDVSRCVLVFLEPPAEPIEHEISGPVLDARIESVRERVGALSA